MEREMSPEQTVPTPAEQTRELSPELEEHTGHDHAPAEKEKNPHADNSIIPHPLGLRVEDAGRFLEMVQDPRCSIEDGASQTQDDGMPALLAVDR